ncbi:hypothetical protein J2T03_003399 [Chryseobacterium lathyri]|nr:hypothetical protein [Chryseobacterium lathyri]
MKKFPLIILTPRCLLGVEINDETSIRKAYKDPENTMITTYS